MDSGLGSDEDRRTSSSSTTATTTTTNSGGRTTTKEQKQLHNQRLLSGCFIDASSLTDDGDVVEERRRDERRQGALIFQTSIPQFSMLQMSSSEDNCAYPVAPSSSASSVLPQEPNTPFNSIVQLDSDLTCKSPLGFYVDLNDVDAEPPAAPPSSSSVARKNIFSMVIDFEAPKKDMPSRLSSSLIAKRKVRDKKPNANNNNNGNGSRPLSAASSSSSLIRNGSNNEDGIRNSSSSSLCSSSNNAEGNQSVSASASDINDIVKEKEDVREEAEEVVKEEEVVLIVDHKECKQTSDFIEKKPSQNEEDNTNDTQQFVKLADLERQTPRVEFSFAPKMSRSIPESSWVESPLLMSRSAGYRSAPHPIEPEPSELSDSFTDTSTSQPRKSVQRLGTDLLRMFLEEIGPDVTVEVEGHKLKAHKCILASRCQYFAAMLSGNWLEASGNVISLQGFTYESVYFALCHIYSGAAHVPDSISLVELASLADMLGLEGLKEVVEHALKQRHCHHFHRPCAGCCTGVVEVLPLAATYGLDELYQKCLAWIRQHFGKVWPSRAFAGLPKELREKCYQQHIIHMIPDTVLDTTIACDKLLTAIPTVRWAEPVIQLANQLLDACHSYMSQHFTSILSSPSFLALETGLSWNISQAEQCLLAAANLLGPEQACRSYSRCYRMLEQSWTPRFSQMLHKIKTQIEQRLIGQAEKVSRCTGWSRMDPMLRSHIKELSRLPLDDPPSTRLPRATSLRSKKYTQNKQPLHSVTVSSSDSSRNSSPGINQTQNRLNTSTGSPSLRRSLLLAARTPQVPPSPSTNRRSTLTQPTQSSAAKSAPSRNLKQQVVEKKTTPTRKATQQSVTANRPIITKKIAPTTDATKTTHKKPTPPAVRKTDNRSNSPRLAKSKETQQKKTASPKTIEKKAEPTRKTIQRSDTFLKEGPTVLQKVMT